jgi:hypothetical protein
MAVPVHRRIVDQAHPAQSTTMKRTVALALVAALVPAWSGASTLVLAPTDDSFV